MSQGIIPRRKWGARAPRAITSQHPNQVHTLVVHHTAGKTKALRFAAAKEMRNIQRQHMDAQGWSDIGYNVVIDRWGRIWEGRGLYRVGAHTLNHNSGTIGVSFMGNYENLKLTTRQIRAFENLKAILAHHGMKNLDVKGHRQMPEQATACPGHNIVRQLKLPTKT